MSLLFALEQELKETSKVVVPAGRHRSARPLVLSTGVVLRGGPGAVIDAQRWLIDAPGETVRLEALSFEGSSVRIERGTVIFKGCSFSGGRAPQFGGGALWVRRGEVELHQCTFMENSGRQGGAVLVDGLARVRAYDSVFAFNGAAQGGAVRVRDGGTFEAVGCTFAQNRALGPEDAAAPGATFRVEGTTTRSSALRLTNCLVAAHARSTAGDLFAGPNSEVALHCCWVPETMQGFAATGCYFGAAPLSPTLAPTEPRALADTARWAASRTHDGQPRTSAVGAFNTRAG